ncbi:Response regulator receiver domain-containing protein [Malonomonas rubra DSM 5091]|uniref:Response regulator receiver domain-containing protein n=1 Tax=Malonomonas rubra DSM 5091 TaxID=1122189 RepID=A0A1M6E0E4_MALRU|nr:response regulator [Malonomonas rubra]SHI78921.1 Response regulator receiver domain-containing protein [Malonomonas rubra DSM 5091]
MKPRIFIFEDEYLIRFSLTAKLTKRGFDVRSFSDPTFCPAISKPDLTCPNSDRDTCCDFLLTDIKMPNLTGLEFIEKQQEKGCNVVFGNKAVMSAAWSDEDLIKAERLGCKIFHKPLDFEAVFGWLEEELGLLAVDRQPVPS